MKSSNNDNGWLIGRLYFNREDKRVIIKRPNSGSGYTMNLGNKWTWIFTVVLTQIRCMFHSLYNLPLWKSVSTAYPAFTCP